MADQHNLAAERLVVGGILIDQLHFWRECVEMDVEAFYNKDLRAVFQAVYNLAHGNRNITPTAVLSRIVELEAGEPRAFISALQHEATKAQEAGQLFVAEYASDIMLHHSRRKAKDWADKVAKEAEKPDFDPVGFFDKAMADASDMVRNTGSINERTIAQSGQETLLMLNEAAMSDGSIVDTGLKTLDMIVGGFIPGDFVLWGGAPGGAKTALAMQMAMHMSLSNHVAFFQLEMDHRLMTLRSIASATGISAREMLQGIRDKRFETISEAVQGMANRKLSIIANHRMTITQVEAQLRAMKQLYGTRVVFVDHLGLIKRNDRYRMKDFEKDNINAEMLMETASALDMTIICLSHFTKAGRQKENPDPEMEDFSGGGIEKHADFMFANLNRYDWLQRHPPITEKAQDKWNKQKLSWKGKMEVFKLKDRRGPGREKVILNWDGERTLMSDIEPDHVPEELLI